jgi:hypothetical protein
MVIQPSVFQSTPHTGIQQMTKVTQNELQSGKVGMIPDFDLPARRTMASIILEAAGLTVAVVVATGLAITVATPETLSSRVYALQVTTEDGNLYNAGTGDSCATAREHAVIPPHWVSMACNRIN